MGFCDKHGSGGEISNLEYFPGYQGTLHYLHANGTLGAEMEVPDARLG